LGAGVSGNSMSPTANFKKIHKYGSIDSKEPMAKEQ